MLLDEAIENIRWAVRLASRRGWVSPEELALELESLPDAADKAQPTEGENS